MKTTSVLHRLFERFWSILCGLLFGWLVLLIEIARRLCRLWKHPRKRRNPCTVPPEVYKRPDPLIYCQEYLMAHGIAVTWNNPDIQLYRDGAPVDSNNLDTDTDYEVRARIWNGSFEAPAVGMPVEFSFLTFGIGTTSTAIDTAFVDLPAKGAPGHPAFGSVNWRTPRTAGHYCLQVRLIWADDANPANNLGQENTNVGLFNSPTARFWFPVRNGAPGPRRITLRADAYGLPPRRACVERPANPRTSASARKRTEDALDRLSRTANPEAFPIPAGWDVQIHPSAFDLDAGEQREVEVVIVAPDEEPRIDATFNVNGYANDHPIGGVTLTARR